MRRVLQIFPVWWVVWVCLVVGVLAVWVLSYKKKSQAGYTRSFSNGATTYFIVSHRGQIALVTQSVQANQPLAGWQIETSVLGNISMFMPGGGGGEMGAPNVPAGTLGFAHVRWDPNGSIQSGALYCKGVSAIYAMPYWSVALVSFMSLPTVMLLRWNRRRHRRNRGQCLACGYDVRASPARCPECGSPTSANS
jgi:hypothetical protein